MRTFLSSLGLLFLSLTTFSQQVAKSLNLNGTTVGFYEFKPYNYNQNPTKKYPLIIFLHGVGEKGNGTTELPTVLYYGLPAYINAGSPMTFTANGETESFMVLSPQLPKWMGYWDASYIDAMLDYAEKNLRVDKDRIFLTGLSLGGGGVWGYASSSLKNAKKFAAIAPVCGVCYYDLKDLPNTIGKADIGVWGFANLDDNVVSPWCTISAIDALAAANKTPDKIKKTINSWGGHDAWTKAYDVNHYYQTPNLYEWFLMQSQKKNNGNNNSDNSSGSAQTPAQNNIPVAKAGNDISITLPLNSVTLNNVGSYDADGTIAGFTWSLVSGPSQPIMSSANAASTGVTNLVAGTYVFRLTVTDNAGASASVDIKVIVSPKANVAPVAKTGSDIAISLPTNSATINNNGSYDSDGTIAAYKWSLVSGPSQPSISTPNAASTQVTNLVVGTYVFRLSVTDNDGATGTSDMKVNVGKATNYAPVAKVEPDASITLPVNSLTINNAGSFDGDGAIAGWKWSQISGPSQATIGSPYAASTQVSNLLAGAYVFKLTVTDNEGAYGSADIKITVNPKNNVLPVAKVSSDVSITLPVNSATISNAGSYDPDGTISSFKWSFVSGPSQPTIASPNAASTQLYNLAAGSFVFRLTITDDDGGTAYGDVKVNVNAAPNVAPVAKAGNDQSITLPTNSVTLNNAGSYDGDGTIRAYVWSWVSGPNQPSLANANSASTQVSSLVAGTYVFRLTVTDNTNATNSDDVTINVNKASNYSPVAKAGGDITITLPTSSVNLNNAGSFDGDGTITIWKWSLVSGPSSPTIVSPNASGSQVNNLIAGNYVFRLTVTDNDGASGSVDIKVNVNPAVVVVPPQPQNPTADAGNDISFNASTFGFLNGTKSAAAQGNKLVKFAWTLVSGPNQYSLLTPNEIGTFIKYAVSGTYVFRLTVTDNNGKTASDDVIATATGGTTTPPTTPAGPSTSQTPLPYAGKDFTVIYPYSGVLDGTSSKAAGTAKLTKFIWTKVSGPAPYNIVTPTSNGSWINNLAIGTYVFRLTVTDNNGLTASDDVSVTVKYANSSVSNSGQDLMAQEPGQNSLAIAEKVTVYPNPVVSMLNINWTGDSKGNASLKIVDATGKLVKTVAIKKEQTIFNTSVEVGSLVPGIYFIQIQLRNNKSIMYQFLKN